MQTPFLPFALAAVALYAHAPAQTIVASSPSPSPSPAPASGRAISAAKVASALRTDLPLLQRGPVSMRPHFRYSYLYGDGIEAGPGNPRDTTIQSITPAALFEIGRYWHFSYTPTWTFYSNEAFRDTFDQIASLSGHLPYGDWVFGATQSYETSHAMLVETGRQTKQEKISSALNAVWQVGKRTQLDLGVNRSARYANAVTDAPEWTTSDWLQYATTDWLRYQLSPRLDVALGLSVGHADVSVGDDMTFTQPQAQIAWRPTQKISLSLQGGREIRRFSGTNNARLSTPIYSGAFSYQPHATTGVTLAASRSVSASYFANEITRGAGWSVTLHQRFVQRLFLETSYSENTNRYLAARALQLVRRDDTYRAINARLSTVVFRRGSFAVLYQTGRNTSDDQLYSFSTHQYGCELSYRF